MCRAGEDSSLLKVVIAESSLILVGLQQEAIAVEELTSNVALLILDKVVLQKRIGKHS